MVEVHEHRLGEHDGKLADHEKRIEGVEHRPITWFDKVVSGIIAAVVAAMMGLFLK